MIDRSSKIAPCAELLRFQKNIARNWYFYAERSSDPRAKFFFCFSGFNESMELTEKQLSVHGEY